MRYFEFMCRHSTKKRVYYKHNDQIYFIHLKNSTEKSKLYSCDKDFEPKEEEQILISDIFEMA